MSTDLPEAILLGIVQGLTEFLPISSTGHLVIVEDLIGVSEDEFGLGFDAATHLGTLTAVLIYFRVLLLSLGAGFVRSIKSRRWDQSQESRLAWLLLLGTIPAGIAGILVEGIAEETFRSPELAALMLILFSIPMIWAERVAAGHRRVADVTLGSTIAIGIAQAVALIPGVSRSGITMSVGMITGFQRQEAATYAFLLSTPIIAAAGGKQILDLLQNGDSASVSSQIGLYTVGLVTAGVVGYGAIALLMRYLRFNTLGVFIAYRIGLGLTILALWVL